MKNYFLYPIKDDALIYGFEVSKFTQANLDTVRSHKHEFYEIYLLINGQVTYTLKKSSTVLENNSLLIIPPDTPHHAEISCDGEIYYRYILWIKSSLVQEIAKKEHFPLSENPQIKHLNANNCATVSHLMDLLFEEQKQFENGYSKPNKKYLRSLLSTLLIYIYGCKKEPSQPTSELVKQITAKVRTDIAEPFSLDDIAAAVFLSKYYLERKFKKETGMTLLQYVTGQKMVYAKNLLNEGISTAEAARKCGYNDYSNFYKTFVREYGISPQKYISSFVKKH